MPSELEEIQCPHCGLSVRPRMWCNNNEDDPSWIVECPECETLIDED